MRAAALAAGGGRRAPEGRGDPRDYRECLGVIVWPGAANGAGRRAGLLACDESARVVAKALTTSGMYSEIAAGFASSADTATIEYAIWASPWASGHYANGGHWSYRPVPVVKSPAGTW